MKNIQKYVCLLAAISSILPIAGASPAIWDLHKEPSRFSSIMFKSLAGGAGGVVFAAVLAALAQSKKNIKSICAAGCLGGVVCGGLTYAACRSNTPEVWLAQFFAKFNEVSSYEFLARSEQSNREWVRSQGSLLQLEALLRLLRKVCVDIPKLERVVDVLISIGLDEFRPETLVDLRANKEQLDKLYNLAMTRCAWISTTVDYEKFQHLHAQLMHAPVLAYSLRNEWMRDINGTRSFKDLQKELSDLQVSFVSIDSIVTRLQSPESRFVLTGDEQSLLAQALPTVVVLRDRCADRLAYVSARADYQDFNELYYASTGDPVVQISGVFGDDEAWLKLNGVQRSLFEVTRDLNRRIRDLKKGLEISQRLLKAPLAAHFSSSETSEINGRFFVLRDLLAMCRERQRIVVGLQKIEDFLVEYTYGMANRLAQESSFGQSDLSWMQFSRNAEWPLEDVCTRLRVLKADLLKTLRQGESLVRSSDLRSLSESRRNVVNARIEALKRAINLVEQRLVILLNSTIYAEEVAKKRSLETAQQEQLDRARQAREAAALRAAEERAHSREEYRQAQQRALTELLAPGTLEPQPLVPSAPSLLESCFCGDDILPGQEYVVSCSCKKSFYHQECITRWVDSSQTCPTCRARVTIADVKKYEKPQELPVVLPTAPPLEVLPAFVVPTAPPAVQQPAIQAPVASPVTPQPQDQAPATQDAEAEECYLCLDSDNIADCTTANCACTVKKPACRVCLQAWLDARHTCPRCQKTGAILVPFVKA